MNLKVTVIVMAFFACFLAVAQCARDSKLKQLAEKCNATAEDKRIILDYKVPETSSGKCLVTCILKFSNTLNADGLFDITSMLEVLKMNWPEIKSEVVLENVVNKCGEDAKHYPELANSNNCEYGYRVAKCVNDQFYSDPILRAFLEIRKKDA